MNRLLKIVTVCLCITQIVLAQTKTKPKPTGTCYYYNDPHLVPFPTSSGDNQLQYFCQPNCTEVLVKNKFLQIFVKSNTQNPGYPIISYTLIFHSTGVNIPACVISDSIANPSGGPYTCPNGSPVTSSISPSYHFYTHTAQNIQVAITYMGGHFNFAITQSFALIAVSEGVCVKSDCPLEGKVGRGRRQVSTDNYAAEICNTFIKTAQGHQFGTIDPQPIPWYQESCNTDLMLTRDLIYPQAVIRSILFDSIQEYQGKCEFQDYLQKADETGNSAIKEALGAVEGIYHDWKAASERTQK